MNIQKRLMAKLTEKQIFQESQEQAEKLLTLLSEGFTLFPKKLVPKELIRKEYTYYKGFIAPIPSVSHRYLYDDYEAPFLDAYISLFKKILEERESFTNEFAFRTFLEMGVENSFIIFDQKVSKDDKKLYILTSLLADYASIDTSMRGMFKNWFNKLYNENRLFLAKKLAKEIKILDNLKIIFDKNELDLEKYASILKQAREMNNKIKARILRSYKEKKVLNFSQGYKRMKSGEAHTLHGNVFLIFYRMRQQPENHLFRLYAYLTISGNDLLDRLKKYLDKTPYSKKVAEYMKNNADFRIKFKKEWEQLKV